MRGVVGSKELAECNIPIFKAMNHMNFLIAKIGTNKNFY
jgi:hypothetical protein